MTHLLRGALCCDLCLKNVGVDAWKYIRYDFLPCQSTVVSETFRSQTYADSTQVALFLWGIRSGTSFLGHVLQENGRYTEAMYCNVSGNSTELRILFLFRHTGGTEVLGSRD